MSTQIEFEQIAIRLSEQQSPSALGGAMLILLVDGGSSSGRNADGRVARHWYVNGYGREADVIREVVLNAADCEGGELRIDSLSRRTRPEAYIRRWRQRIAAAWTLDYALAARHSFSFRIDLDANRVAMAMSSTAGAERLRRLIEACPPVTVAEPGVFRIGPIQRHEFNVCIPAQMAVFNDMHDLGHGPWSRKVHATRRSFYGRASTQGSLGQERIGIGHTETVRAIDPMQA